MWLVVVVVVSAGDGVSGGGSEGGGSDGGCGGRWCRETEADVGSD